MSYTSPEKQLRVSLFWETDPNLSLASRPRDRGRSGWRICLNRSRLRFPTCCGKRQGAPDWSTLTGWARHPPRMRGHLECVSSKLCCQHCPGGARCLFFQITSSRLVSARGDVNRRQGRSFSQALWGMFVLHRFVRRRRGDGGRRKTLRFARVKTKGGVDHIPTFFVDCTHREVPTGLV